MYGEGDRKLSENINPLQTINLEKLLNPKPPYECHAIRRNPDLIKLADEEPPLFREDYEEYTMASGQKVYQREIMIDVDYDEWDSYTDIQIISQEEWEQLPIQSTGKLAKFRKEIESCVWKSRGNGIHHYSKWHEFPVFHLDNMFKKIDVPKLEFRETSFDAKHSMEKEIEN